jgi:hypothetical protein
MSEGALGIRIKLERARRHAEELDRASREYLQSDPFTIVEAEEVFTGDLVSLAMIKRRVPPELGAIIGDVVHNLCCTLDQLAWQLVLANGQTPHNKTAFPYAETGREFRKKADYRLQGASATAIDLVKKMQVHPNGDADLWRVCRLDVEDKHKLLIPVGIAHESVEVLHVRVTTPEDAPPPSFPCSPAVPSIGSTRFRMEPRSSASRSWREKLATTCPSAHIPSHSDSGVAVFSTVSRSSPRFRSSLTTSSV